MKENNIVKQFIQSVITQLNEDKKECDSALLYMLECNYALFIECQTQISQLGLLIPDSKGNLTKNPLLKVQTDAQIQCLKCLNDMMITPKQRAKSATTNIDEESPLMAFSNQNK